MPIIKSAKKRVRVSDRKSSVNTLHRSGAKTAVRTAKRAIDAEAVDSENLVRQAASRLDRAATKGALHPNKAARLKSRLSAKLKLSKVKTEAGSKKAETKKTTAEKSA